MTNILAAVIITVGTNWQTIGTFTPSPGPNPPSLFATHDIQEGRLVTNTVAIMEWKGDKREVLLEANPGPIIGERRVERPMPRFGITAPVHGQWQPGGTNR